MAHSRRHLKLASARADAHTITVANAQADGVRGIELKERLAFRFHQFGGAACAGHSVPLVLDSTRHQREGIVVIDRISRRRQMRNVHPRSSVRGVESAVFKQSTAIFRRAGSSSRGIGPLDSGSVLGQQRIGNARDVHVAAAGQLSVLVEDLFETVVTEGIAVTQRLRHATDDLPVRQRLARRPRNLLKQADAALGVGHRPGPLRPLRGRQQDIGDLRRFGRVVSVLHDHGLGSFESGTDAVAVGQ